MGLRLKTLYLEVLLGLEHGVGKRTLCTEFDISRSYLNEIIRRLRRRDSRAFMACRVA